MAEDKGTTAVATDRHECDVRVWCPSCKRSDYTQNGDKYLCTACGKIMNLQHEMHHEHFPHLSGDEEEMS